MKSYLAIGGPLDGRPCQLPQGHGGPCSPTDKRCHRDGEWKLCWRVRCNLGRKCALGAKAHDVAHS